MENIRYIIDNRITVGVSSGVWIEITPKRDSEVPSITLDQGELDSLIDYLTKCKEFLYADQKEKNQVY